MLLSDCHSHSTCSPDGHYTMLEMAQGARSAGMDILTLTDHCDLVSQEGELTFTYSWEPYKAQFQEARDRCPEGLELLRGVELGESYENPAAARKILSEAPPLDFIIGSVHNASERLNRLDFYSADYSDREACVAALDDCLNCTEELLALEDCYDTLGHLLYPVRYIRQAGLDVDFTHPKLFPRVEYLFSELARRGKAMEVNTWRGRTVDEWEPWLRLFRKVGGRFVTVGSDAHRLEHLGQGIEAAIGLVKQCGFPGVAVYRGRRPYIME